MKKKSKAILVSAFFGIILLTSTLAIALNSNLPKTSDNRATMTGTPADNFSDEERTTYCGTGASKSNRYITEFKIPTVCTQPLAITTDPSGMVWFTESNTGKLAKFDPFSKLFTEYENTRLPKGVRSMMWGIDYALDENIWFTDESHDVLWKFSIVTKNYTSFSYPVSNNVVTFPQRLVIDNKNILVNDLLGNKITSFDSTQLGNELNYSIINSEVNNTVTGSPTIDSNGKLWYVVWVPQKGLGALVSYDRQANIGTVFKLPVGIIAPNGISSDHQNNIWITDAATNFFISFDSTTQKFTKYVTSTPRQSVYGNATGIMKNPNSNPYWNKVDSNDRVWFNEHFANSIAVFDPKTNSLVEYLIPSQNPNWRDCTGLENCGTSMPLDFTINGDKIWFTEWVENNIGLLESSTPLPIEVNLEPKEIILNKGETSTLSFTITQKEQLDGMITLTTANTAAPNDIIVSGVDKKITVENQPETVSLSLSASEFALSGTYKLLVGAQYNEVTISQFITITIK